MILETPAGNEICGWGVTEKPGNKISFELNVPFSCHQMKYHKTIKALRQSLHIHKNSFQGSKQKLFFVKSFNCVL